MALGRRCGSNANCADRNLGLGFVRNTRSMSGKRVALLCNTDATKKHCSEKMIPNHEQSMIESLSLDILVSTYLAIEMCNRVFSFGYFCDSLSIIDNWLDVEICTHNWVFIIRNSIPFLLPSSPFP